MSEEGLFSLTSLPMSMNPVEHTEGHLRACHHLSWAPVRASKLSRAGKAHTST